MTLDVLKKRLAIFAAILLAFTAMTACSDKDDEPNVDPEDPEELHLGAWRLEWDDDDDVLFIVFDRSKVTFYDTTYELLENDEYEDKTTGSYTVFDDGDILVTRDGETALVSLVEKNGRTYLDCDGDLAYRVDRSDVPSKKAGSGNSGGSSSSSDALSGTSWKITSMTGWGADAISEWRNVQLRFGNNGKVTEWYSSSESYSGTYTISGNIVNLKNIPLVNEWGPKYNYSISGSRLTLTADKGSSMETSFVLSKI